MFSFTSHYDASGSEGDRDGVLVVVGLLAHEYKWLRFEEEWNAVLRKFDVPYFHRKELGERRNGIGVYGKWANDEITPRKFVQSLQKVLRRQINMTFCRGVELADYALINRLYRLRETVGSPYVLTAGLCYDAVNAWGRRKYPKAPSLHIFESGDCGQRDFLKLAKHLGHTPKTHPKIDPVTKKWFVPFQGADLVAGAWRYAAGKRTAVKDFAEYGEEFNELINKLAQDAKVVNRQTLLTLCRNHPDKVSRRDKASHL